MIDLPYDQCFSPYPTLPARLLRACPVYKPSPLRSIKLDSLPPILVKDETNRMGLGAFKALGGVYAVARIVEASFKEAMGEALPPEELLSERAVDHAQSIVFVCASAGNHGIAVAAGAKLFGARSRIHLSEGVPDSFADRLSALGADVVRSGPSYETSMQAALEDSKETGATLLSDGSWSGYTKPPSLVMEGYTVLAEELRETFEETGNWPSHVYLQGGVGGLAAAMAHMIRQNWKGEPKIVIVEPDAAPCIRQSVIEQKVVEVNGPASNMGRLDCKVPSIVALEVLNKCASEFILISDTDASDAVERIRPHGIGTTPSGAAGLAGLLVAARKIPKEFENARPLVIVSEGTC